MHLLRSSALALITGLLGFAAAPSSAWVLELPESCQVAGLRVTLGDVALGELPPEAADIVLVGKGVPGRTYDIERRGLLRTLVSRRLAADVVLRGAETCRVSLTGTTVSLGRLENELLRALAPWIPAAAPGGPEPAVALAGELPEVAVDGDWTLIVDRNRTLSPGRNSVGVEVRASHGVVRFTTTVHCHVYGETARAHQGIAKGEALTEGMFTWTWSNLSQLEPGLNTGRESLLAMVAARELQAGDMLREADLRRAPLVHQGEPVELVLGRGGVEVTLRGIARQDGAMDQIISVRNELDGHLVTGRVTGPGRVAWRK